MKINSFEQIIAWQKSKELTILIYTQFKNCKDFSFKDQIQRAVISMMNNIAEGYERNGNKEFRNFLYIAKGSSAEVRSMLMVALELGYITQDEFEKSGALALEIARILSGLIKKL